MHSNYKISVIIPIYNTEKYLKECIDSIVNQTLDFKDNIQLLLINDGSIDNSEEICLKYKKQFNENIIYYKQKNSGVSQTRNKGMSLAEGKYILFLDSDDKLNTESLKSLYDFFEENYEEIDFVISRVRLFEKVNKWHYMDFRFKQNKIVDINKDILFSQYHSSGILIKREAVTNLSFDKDIKYGEDMKFMSELIIQKGKFGIQNKSILYYRIRNDSTSAVQTQKNNKSWYIETIEKSFMYIFDICEKKYGKVPPYFQYYIMNSIRERFGINSFEMSKLNKEEYLNYINNLKKLLKNISADIICMQKRLDINYILYCLSLKENNKISFNIFKDKLDSYNLFTIVNVIREKNHIKCVIKINNYILDINKLTIKCKDKVYKMKKIEKEENNFFDLYGNNIEFDNNYSFLLPTNFFKSYQLFYDNKYFIPFTLENVNQTKKTIKFKKYYAIIIKQSVRFVKNNFFIRILFKLIKMIK